MANMDVFNADAFSLISLSGTVDKVPFVPGLLGRMGLFTPAPVRTNTLWVDRREGILELINTSAIGAPPEELRKDERSAVALKAVRLAKGATIYAAEIAEWRAFGTEAEQTSIMREYGHRRERVRKDMEATHELHRLGALQGKLIDANGSVIYDYFTEFGVAPNAVETWNLTATTTDPRQLAMAMKRKILRNAKGLYGENVRIGALVGDSFFDALIGNAKVRETYLNWNQAVDLRENKAFEDFRYGGIDFFNYRGTDAPDEIRVADDEAIFFIMGVEGIYRHAMAPVSEFISQIGNMGQNVYEMVVRDLQRESWIRCEMYSQGLHFNQRPELVEKAKLG